MAPNNFGGVGSFPCHKRPHFSFRKKRPPLSRVPIDLVSPHPQIPDSILRLLEGQAVERVHDPCSPVFFSLLFLIHKESGSRRPVIDLSVQHFSSLTDFHFWSVWDSSACRDFSPPVLDHVSSETGRSYTGPVTVHFAGTSLPSSSSALSLSLLEMVFGQSAYTDSIPSVLSPPPSLVARL